MEDGTPVRTGPVGRIANPARGADARNILRTTRARTVSSPRRGPRQRSDTTNARGATIALALRRLEREHLALLLAICELDGPMGAQESPAMRAALLVLLRADLGRTQHALALAAEGRYGSCEDCDRSLARRELELNPAATHCPVCQAQARRSSHMDGR